MKDVSIPPEPVLPPKKKPDRLAILLRIAVYAFIAMVGMTLFPSLMMWWGDNLRFVASALGIFAAAAVANAIVLRIYESGQLADIGLEWTFASRKNLAIGSAAGIGGALIAILAPVVLRASDFVRTPESGFNWGSVIFVSVVLLFGAIGEEMLFRGYAFQLLLGYMGAFATILPFAVLFAFAHLGNPGQGAPIIGWIAPLNTLLWGILLGYGFVRSGDLWLPIGLHFGWNWMLSLLGANVSGFRIVSTGIALQSRNDVLTGGAYGPEGGIMTTVVVMLLAYALYRAPVDRQTPVLVRSAEAWS